MTKKKTHAEFAKELKEINPSITPLQRYRGNHTHIRVLCNRCGYEWSPEPNSLLHGIGCPACSGRVPIKGKNDFATLHPELLIDWDYTTNDANGVRPDQYTSRSGKKVWWKCHVCGEKWPATIDKRVAGRGCPRCSKKKRDKARRDSLIKKHGSLVSEYPELMLDWDYEENSKRGISPEERTTQSNQMAHWKCHVCSYEWDAIISNRTKGAGCPVCANKTVAKGINDLATTNPELIKEWDAEKNLAEGVNYTDISAGSEYKAHWKCSYCGHEWQAYVYSRTGGTGCPVCAKRWQSSIPEQALFYYIRKTIPDVINSYHPDWLRPSEIDIFIPELNLGIEYDGEAWHKNVGKDLEKDLLCKHNGIDLLRVREPQCPELKGRKMTYIRESKSVNTIDQMVKGVFDIIESEYNITLYKDISYERDQDVILGNLQYHELKYNITQIPGKAEFWDYERNGDLMPEFFSPNSEIRVFWKCNECGYSWEAKIKDFIKAKSCCPVCSGRILIEGVNDFATECPNILEDWDYDKNSAEGIYPNKIRKTYNGNVHWKCKACGYEWTAKPINRYYGKTGCPNCYKIRANKKVEIGHNDLKTTHPEIAKEWHQIKNGVLTPYEVVAGSHNQVWWQCKKGHEWQARISSRTKKGTGCPYCSGRKAIVGENDLATTHSEIAKEWHPTKNGVITPQDVKAGSGKKAWWRCQKCGYEWQSTIVGRTKGKSKCPYCK